MESEQRVHHPTDETDVLIGRWQVRAAFRNRKQITDRFIRNTLRKIKGLWRVRIKQDSSKESD